MNCEPSLAATRAGRAGDAALITCEDLACTFGSGPAAVVAVHGVSCELQPGAEVAITGPSGSGKSTLLHLMAGLQTPTAGVIQWPGLDGHPLAEPGRVGVIFQGPSLLPALDVMENVALPLVLGDTPPKLARERAMNALAALQVGDLAGKLPEELSGGQAQRVAVARVLAANPRLILADEPTGQLDHEAAALVMDVLLQASAELGAALVVSTHDPIIAARLPQQWIIRDGTLVRSAGLASVPSVDGARP
jgi:ABC-type lipoprotein export system ATPase subunit